MTRHLSGETDVSSETIAILKRQRLVLNEVQAERYRQDDKWGGEEHDDKHSHGDFVEFIYTKLMRANDAILTTQRPEQRRRMVQLAALAVANIERIDRLLDVPSDEVTK
jgi:hypothetical protein